MSGWMKEIHWESVGQGSPIEPGKTDTKSTAPLLRAEPKPAGIWIRFVANFVDFFVLMLLSLPAYFAFSEKSLVILILSLIPEFFYKPLMEWRFGATLGKMACGIKVVDGEGKNLTLRAAYIRFSPFLAAAIVATLGGVWIFMTPEFQNATGFEDFALNIPDSPFDTASMILTWLVNAECLIAAFNSRKRAVHDMLAGSYCVWK